MNSQDHHIFLGSEISQPDPEEALFHILPVPLESSVSYGRGTAAGPEAIIAASRQLELFDGLSVPADAGIHTHGPLSCTCGGGVEEVLSEISRTVSHVLGLKKIPVLLGGEHTVTLGALRALQEQGQADFGIVQFDAHADLRHSYEGNPYSHACVMRRAHDLGIPIFQIGVRSLCLEEASFRQEQGIGHLDAAAIAAHGFPSPLLPPGFPEKIYLSLDIDVLDCGIMPATGTPEPGGLDWYQLFAALETIVASCTVVSLDLVELAPITGFHAPDYTAARLLYNLFGLITRK